MIMSDLGQNITKNDSDETQNAKSSSRSRLTKISKHGKSRHPMNEKFHDRRAGCGNVFSVFAHIYFVCSRRRVNYAANVVVNLIPSTQQRGHACRCSQYMLGNRHLFQ